MTIDKYTKVRKNAENTAKKVSIFDKDDDRLKKIKERHRLSKEFLKLLLEKSKAEASKYTNLETTDKAKDHSSLRYKDYCLLNELDAKNKEIDNIKVECMELQMCINNIFNYLCKSTLMRIINELREDEAKAEEKYNETYTKWDEIADNRATLMGKLYKLTTDNINLNLECMQLQMRIDFCNERNLILGKIRYKYLGLEYL